MIARTPEGEVEALVRSGFIPSDRAESLLRYLRALTHLDSIGLGGGGDRPPDDRADEFERWLAELGGLDEDVRLAERLASMREVTQQMRVLGDELRAELSRHRTTIDRIRAAARPLEAEMTESFRAVKELVGDGGTPNMKSVATPEPRGASRRR